MNVRGKKPHFEEGKGYQIVHGTSARDRTVASKKKTRARISLINLEREDMSVEKTVDKVTNIPTVTGS